MGRADGGSRPRLTARAGKSATLPSRAAAALLSLALWACAPPPAQTPVATPPPEEPPAAEPLRLAHAGIGPVDRVVVHKAERRLYLMRAGRVLAWVPVSLGREPVGPKRQRGDLRTPEGEYVLDWRQPSSRFHRAIHISYPGAEDLAQAFARDVDAGGDIFIHGTPDPVLLDRDWTNGCIAVANPDIDIIWDVVPDGTPITILP